MEKAGNDDNNNIFVVALLSWLPHLALLFGSQGSLGDRYCLSPPHPTDPVPSPLSCISCKQRCGGSLAGCVHSWDNLAMTWEPQAPGPTQTGPDQARPDPHPTFLSIKMQKGFRTSMKRRVLFLWTLWMYCMFQPVFLNISFPLFYVCCLLYVYCNFLIL